LIDVTQTDKSPVKLSELTKEIADVVNGHFGHKFYWVIAEVTSHRFVAKNGYHYFELSEKHGPAQTNITKISCTALSVGSEAIRNFESYTRQKFDNNLEVMVKIKVDYSIEYGLRTILQDVDVAFTIGNLEKLKQQTLARLLKDEAAHIQKLGEQYITTNKKLSYPGIIKGIALITSKESEGYADFCHTLTANHYGYQFHLFKFFCKVQSETAGEEIIACLKTIYTSYRRHIDAVVICRGGGAQTDFLTFNQYNISRAVARFPIPIITGIGHHRNQSLVDLLVRTETKTPTQAAEFIINHCHSSEIKVLDLQKSITVNGQKIMALN
jgi:exodeoxyribonuclease VII large subunit